MVVNAENFVSRKISYHMLQLKKGKPSDEKGERKT